MEIGNAANFCSDFSHCLNEAKRNLDKSGGREYDKKSAIYLNNVLGNRISMCATANTKEQSFTIIFLLGKGGKQLHTETNSKTEYAKCVLSLSKPIRFPKPPTTKYWTFLNFGYNPNPIEGE